MSKIFIGFDCSSTTIGWGVLDVDKDIKYKDSGFIKPNKKLSIIDNLADTRDQINNVLNEQKPDFIGIEDIILFMAKRSSAQTIVKLATFNRMVALCCRDYLNRSPELINVIKVRKSLSNSKTTPSKEEVYNLLEFILNCKLKKVYNTKMKLKDETYDMSDGVAVAYYCAINF